LKKLKSISRVPSGEEGHIEGHDLDLVSPSEFEGVRSEAESASHQANETREEVDKVRCEVEDLRDKLREMREFAERAIQEVSEEVQRKTERVSRLSPEVSMLLELQAALPESTFEPLRSDVKTLNQSMNLLRSYVKTLRVGMDSQIIMDFRPRRKNPWIVSKFEDIFTQFRGKRFRLLWCGSRDGFHAHDFHRLCDGHENTLTVILDTNGNIFGGFTPVKWECPANDDPWKEDTDSKGFLFTLKNPHNVSPRKFALKSTKKDHAILCCSRSGPNFGDIYVCDQCNEKAESTTSTFGRSYKNDTKINDDRFFTGSNEFQVKEIEVFEIIT
jgi:hypothetical protein